MTPEPTPLVTVLPCEAEIERVTRAMYEDWPLRVISEALVKASGQPMGSAISWEKSIEMGADHSGMRRLAASALKATGDARLAVLVEALRPFKLALEEWSDEERFPDDRSLWDHPLGMCITIGDFRRAAQVIRALSNKGGRDGE